MRVLIVRSSIAPMSTIGTLLYQREDGGVGTIHMDHRCFWNLVEGFGNPVGHLFDYEDGLLRPVEAD